MAYKVARRSLCGIALKIGSILLELASLVFYIYYNHKHSNENHRDENKKQK